MSLFTQKGQSKTSSLQLQVSQVASPLTGFWVRTQLFLRPPKAVGQKGADASSCSRFPVPAFYAFNAADRHKRSISP